MKKLSLITEFKESYKGSDLQKIVNNNPLPIKYTINDFDCYFYNADLFGLFEWNIKKDGITTNDFINDYQKGFEKGLLHLKELEKIKLKDLKSKDLREGTILQLKNILHEREFKLGSKGLLDLVFNEVPLIFTEKNIFDYGYWNGIIYSIDDIIEKAGLTFDELKTSESQNKSRTKKVIAETFENMDKKGWQYAFVSEQDYNLFTDLLTNFFEYKPYTLPETIIQLKRTCKTKVAKALGEIHKELSNENKLSTDTKYFQLIRVLSHFEKETKEKLLSIIDELGITQKKASEILGITQATFSRKKKGVDGYYFKDSDLEKIKEFYKIKN